MLMFVLASEGGLMGIFHDNVINWFLLVAVIVYFWMRMTPAMFAARKDKIETALKEASQAKLEGQQFLSDQQARIANAEKEAAKILEEAKTVAKEMKEEISQQSAKESDELRKRISQQIEAEEQLAITELRSQAAIGAVRLAEAALPGAINESSKKRLMGQFVEQLEQVGGKK